MNTQELTLKLHAIGAIKFGEFRLKSGILSPVYVDLRQLVSHPEVLDCVADRVWTLGKDLSFDLLCGVPYTALPIATAISVKRGLPMVMRRKEVKRYGTRKAIEGAFEPGQECLVVEDLITSGASVMETVEALSAEGLRVRDVVLLLDREQGGPENLAEKGITVHSILSLRDAVTTCVKAGRVAPEVAEKVDNYLSQTFSVALPQQKELTYGARAELATNAAARQLLTLMQEKRTNLSFNPDVSKKADFLRLADQVGPEICLLKTHVDLLDDFDSDFIIQLQALADKHHFMIFEDRKFADIGNTVRGQYQGGIYRIADWAHITNAHMVPGPGIVEGLKQIGLPKGRGLMLLAEMSSMGTLATGNYTEQTVRCAAQHKDFVIGFIAIRRVSDDPALIHLTPGVQLQPGSDNLKQEFRTPDLVIRQQGTDIIQVGRGIYCADDPLAAAKQYRAAGWEAYERRLREVA